MSTFSSLNAAASALFAQRKGLAVAAQNAANVNTDGYTRQRVDLQPVSGSAPASITANATWSPGGVTVNGITRLGDAFLETRMRQQSASAGYTGALSDAWTRIESSLGEPSEDTAISARLGTFFSAWQDIANRPEDDAARAVLLQRAQSVVSSLRDVYTTTNTQWTTLRAEAQARVDEVNVTASKIANLNDQIRNMTASGADVNELLDQRSVLATQLSELVGAEMRYKEDGTADIMVGGNALVSGSSYHTMSLAGTTSFSALASSATQDSTESVRLVWADSGRSVNSQGGEINGMIAALAPAEDGGPLLTVAQAINETATDLASSVNALHQTALTTAGTQGGDFFALPADAGEPVLEISVAISNTEDIAVRDSETQDEQGSALNSAIADKISRLTSTTELWSNAVVSVGVEVTSVNEKAATAESTRLAATSEWEAVTAPDADEEAISMISYQRAFQASARAITAVDEMLDTLINGTGVVGR
jgi:flagellar hook-associated protein 1 FlgK